jgi:hypothetical protein
MKETLKNKHGTDLNENIILRLVEKYDCVKAHINIYYAFNAPRIMRT